MKQYLLFDLIKAFIRSRVIFTNLIFFFGRPVFLHECATCFELPPTISTMCINRKHTTFGNYKLIGCCQMWAYVHGSITVQSFIYARQCPINTGTGRHNNYVKPWLPQGSRKKSSFTSGPTTSPPRA